MLAFDAEISRLLEDGYQGADFARRRMANLEALAPERGNRIVDIDCGPVC